ncbi:M20/M25/M40 family metallo-hydrolase [Janibacter sp. DB-40]|uniref:M20/M25/M40 family metallo-hydrolase n=1 Tax=Janibacter sp. DB-40 TaxID=3028808 RepID=UPI0024077617|nr:M20/M25/M40 family metallo-hydrolase [Janibacter sp. DB-40]
MRSRTAAVTAAAATAALAMTTLAAGPAQAKNPNNSKKMTEAVTLDNVHDHLEEFQAIADANDGNRGAGTSGYEASAQYVETTLQDAGYETERQDFTFVYEEVHATSLSEISPDARDVDHVPMSYSQPTPEGGVTGELIAPASATGCDAAAWDGVDLSGDRDIALVSRGDCSFAAKAVAAGESGAEAVIIYNNEEGPLNGTLGGVEPTSAPATGITMAEGQALLEKMAAGPVTMNFVLDKTMEERETFNVLAETDTGRDDNVVMLGAHLDSTNEGPGINDNGSGTAGILETAVQLGEVNKLNNKVRFAFWGAEELGLIGSDHYVADLAENDPAALDDIATYLNFDMIASPNHIIGVYDADESTYEAPVEVPQGSAATEEVFTDYFDAANQPWVDTEFSGRSDYSAFINAGVPASGLFTGADGTKTEEEVEMFGGTAGITYDPNYHTAEDDIDNINMEALDTMSDAIAHSAITLGQSTKEINGKTSRGKSGKPGPTVPVAPEGSDAA